MKQKFPMAFFFGIVFLVVAGALSSCDVQTKTASAPPAVTVGSHSPIVPPTIAPPPGAHSLTLTLADSGKHVLVKPGDVILFALDDTFYSQWTITVADPGILSIVEGTTLPPHSQALYKANKPGDTTITAIGEPKCRSAVPPCQIQPRRFVIQITVQ